MRLILRIDDLGRRPNDPPERGSDGDLEYFAAWRQACGWAGLPVTYSAVPTWLTEAGLQRLAGLSGGEEVAVHGWDHGRGLAVTPTQMVLAREKLLRCGRPVRAYVPPFNAFDTGTIAAWEAAGGSVFFGGFPEDDNRGPYPSRVGNVLFLPACPELYGTSKQVVPMVNLAPENQVVVLTLHIPWEIPDYWHHGKSLRELIAGSLCSPEALHEHALR